MTTIAPLNQEPARFLDTPNGDRLAWRRVEGQGPTLLWLGGFLSDMTGNKIAAMSDLARIRGWDFLCFDYFAHGETAGSIADARVGRWRDNALAVVDQLTQGPLVAIGSSMGAHMLSMVIQARPERIRAAGFLAPAADFATALLLPSLSPEDRRQLEVGGTYMMPGYDRPVPLSQTFFTEALTHRVLDKPIVFDGPVRILHGMKDDLVPWRHGLRLAEAFTSADVRIELVKDGDHRLSRPQDLARLTTMAEDLRAQVAAV